MKKLINPKIGLIKSGIETQPGPWSTQGPGDVHCPTDKQCQGKADEARGEWFAINCINVSCAGTHVDAIAALPGDCTMLQEHSQSPGQAQICKAKLKKRRWDAIFGPLDPEAGTQRAGVAGLAFAKAE